jgi:hypothetical protein
MLAQPRKRHEAQRIATAVDIAGLLPQAEEATAQVEE